MPETLALLASDTPIPSHLPPNRLNGARIATTESILALFRYGSFDAYDVFVQEDHAQDFSSYAAQWVQHGASLERVRFIPLALARQTLQTRRYTAIHDPSSPRLARLAALTRPLTPEPTPLTATVHSLSYANLIPQFIDEIVSNLFPFDSTFCTSQDAHDTLEHILDHLTTVYNLTHQRHPHRLDLAPLGIETAHYHPTISREQARRLLQLDPTTTYLLYFGRLSPFDKADLDVLLRTLQHLRSRNPHSSLQLLLAGDDTQQYSSFLRSRAQQLGCANAIHLFTNATLLQKQLLLWSADIFISPVDSLQESFGLAVIEAMAAGLPVIVSDWGGYRDLVQEGIQGYRIPTYWSSTSSAVDTASELGNFVTDHILLSQTIAVDEDLLLQRLQLLLDTPELRTRMAEAARQHAQRYDWSIIIRHYEALWRELKQQALHTPLPVPPPIRFPFSTLFAHYPTKLLQPDDLIERRPDALLIPPIAPQIKPLLSDATFERLLNALQRGPQHVRTLARNEQDRIALLWLLKAGLVRLQTPPSPRSR